MKPKNSGADVPSIRKSKVDGVLIELGSKTTSKSTFCEAGKGPLREKTLVSSLDPNICVL